MGKILKNQKAVCRIMMPEDEIKEKIKSGWPSKRQRTEIKPLES